MFFALTLATIAMIPIAQRLKVNGALVLGIHQTGRFVPGERCAKLSFYLGKEETISVAVVGPHGDVVSWLARDRRIGARERTTVYWSGRHARSKEPMPTGAYRFLLVLRTERRTLRLPTPVQLQPQRTSGPRIAAWRYRRSCGLS